MFRIFPQRLCMNQRRLANWPLSGIRLLTCSFPVRIAFAVPRDHQSGYRSAQRAARRLGTSASSAESGWQACSRWPDTALFSAKFLKWRGTTPADRGLWPIAACLKYRVQACPKAALPLSGNLQAMDALRVRPGRSGARRTALAAPYTLSQGQKARHNAAALGAAFR